MAGKTNRALASLLLRRSAGIANLFPASTRIRSEWRPCRTWRVNLRVEIKRVLPPLAAALPGTGRPAPGGDCDE